MTLLVDNNGDLIERPKTLEVNGVRYMIDPVYQDTRFVNDVITTLATVIDIRDCQPDITGDWIQQCIESYKQNDDVFQVQFLRGILFLGGQDGCSLSADAKSTLAGFGTQCHWFLKGHQSIQPLPGPYVLINGVLHEPLRLYADTHAAFFMATRNPQRTELPGDNHGYVEVPVPSRLRSSRSQLPLSCIRVGVKDNFDLREKSQSAPCIQRILDLGAFIVGKTKLCAFAQWEEPTEAIEYTSPWSARADGFQSSGGSSNGSGAAIAAYDWLDITIGSDTYWELVDPEQREMAKKFANEVALALRIPLKSFSLKEMWERNPPEDASDQSLEKYMIKANMWFDDYHAFDDFRQQHWEQYHKAPYLTPPTRVAWDFGKSIAESDRDEAARKVQIFRAWFRAQFFQDSQPLSIMPIENTVPRYRDDPPE
ncbi:MAG: hypothetical protein Q9207_004187 [Kuettlingeria erythrocarpa]